MKSGTPGMYWFCIIKDWYDQILLKTNTFSELAIYESVTLCVGVLNECI